MQIHTRLDEFETQTEFKDRNDTLSEFRDLDDTPLKVRGPAMYFTLNTKQSSTLPPKFLMLK